MNAAERLGKRVGLLRKQRGLSQGEFGRRLGVSQQQVAKLESGLGGYSLATLDKIARALGLRLDIAFKTAGPIDRDEAEEIAVNIRWFNRLSPLAKIRAVSVLNRATKKLMQCKRIKVVDVGGASCPDPCRLGSRPL